MQILLSEKLNKKSVNVNKTLNINVSGNKKILPETSIEGVVNAYDLYEEERSNSNKFRLILDINPFCSNVLFNPVTEVVKNEGSDDAECLNFAAKKKSEINGVYGKPSGFIYNEYEAVRDTQLSNERCGYDYHCGLDIFNNHILRGYTYKAINMFNGVYDNFNTIDDVYRTVDGQWIGGDTWETVYDYLNSSTFAESYTNNLTEENGWFGFSNKSKMPSYIIDKNNLRVGNLLINKVINDKNACDFIDMYPGRDLFSFTPLLNKHRKRYEQNWNYCVTYPSRSETEGYAFLRQIGDKCNLKALMIDEFVTNDNGLNVLTVYSVTMHGLQEGDLVNIYVGEELKYENAEVISVPDKYAFQVAKTEGNISYKWLSVSSGTNTYTVKNEQDAAEEYIYDESNGTVRFNGKTYYVSDATNRCNIDDNAQDISFCEVLNGVESYYYVRMFSRLPNFKFADTEINDYTVNKDGSDLIQRYSNPSDAKCSFENHIGKLGFAKTGYGDEISEIVFTDDLNSSYLRDNLGRPLSELYFTITKNNAGYKEWYGVGGKSRNIASDNVEFSHCFGPVVSGFLLSPHISKKSTEFISIKDMTNSDGEEIDFSSTIDFVGDISAYNPVLCEEKHIQNAMHRFNTVQREMKPDGLTEFFYNDFSADTSVFDSNVYINPFGHFGGDSSNHSSDDYVVVGGTRNGATVESGFGGRTIVGKTTESESEGSDDGENENQTTSSLLKSPSLIYRMPDNSGKTFYYPEGYYYQSSYVIPIKEYDNEIMSVQADMLDMYSISEGFNSWLGVPTYLFCTDDSNYLSNGDKSYIYNSETNKIYTLMTIEVHTPNKFTAVLCDEKGKYVRNGFGYEETDDGNNITSFRLFRRPADVPLYAKVIMDGSCRFYWRNLIPIDEYPFTNGAFYIKKDINFYLRRQDPHSDNLAVKIVGPDYVPSGEETNFYPSTNIEDYSEEIEEC